MKVSQRTGFIGALGAIVILAVGFAAYYTTTTSAVASLKKSGNTVCQENSILGSALQSMVHNATLTLQSQIAVDQAIIIVLNSTRPDGYLTIVATLQGAVNQDLRSLNYIYSILPPAVQPVTPDPCSSFT